MKLTGASLFSRRKPRPQSLRGIFDDKDDIFGPPTAYRRRSSAPPRHGATFSCSDLRKELLKVQAAVLRGERKQPGRKELLREMDEVFGRKPHAVAGTIFNTRRPGKGKTGKNRPGRCAEYRPDPSSASVRELFEGVAFLGAGPAPTFECEDMEAVLRSTEKRGVANVAKLLSERMGYGVPENTVRSSLDAKQGRCGHLHTLVKKARGGFTCEDLEHVMQDATLMGYGHKASTLAKLMTQKMGQEIPATQISSVLAQRCRHLRAQRERGHKGFSFTCKELEPMLLKYRGQTGAKVKAAKALGVGRNPVDTALKGRCKHLQHLYP